MIELRSPDNGPPPSGLALPQPLTANPTTITVASSRLIGPIWPTLAISVHFRAVGAPFAPESLGQDVWQMLDDGSRAVRGQQLVGQQVGTDDHQHGGIGPVVRPLL